MHLRANAALLLGLALLAPPPSAKAQLAAAEARPVAAAAPLIDDEEGIADEERARGRRRSCPTLRRQIAHFHDVLELAKQRDDELWERGTRDHIERLEARQRGLCPQDVAPGLGERLAALALNAGRIALTAFTMGAF